LYTDTGGSLVTNLCRFLRGIHFHKNRLTKDLCYIQIMIQ